MHSRHHSSSWARGCSRQGVRSDWVVWMLECMCIMRIMYVSCPCSVLRVCTCVSLSFAQFVFVCLYAHMLHIPPRFSPGRYTDSYTSTYTRHGCQHDMAFDTGTDWYLYVTGYREAKDSTIMAPATSPGPGPGPGTFPVAPVPAATPTAGAMKPGSLYVPPTMRNATKVGTVHMP